MRTFNYEREKRYYIFAYLYFNPHDSCGQHDTNGDLPKQH